MPFANKMAKVWLPTRTIKICLRFALPSIPVMFPFPFTVRCDFAGKQIWRRWEKWRQVPHFEISAISAPARLRADLPKNGRKENTRLGTTAKLSQCGGSYVQAVLLFCLGDAKTGKPARKRARTMREQRRQPLTSPQSGKAPEIQDQIAACGTEAAYEGVWAQAQLPLWDTHRPFPALLELRIPTLHLFLFHGIAIVKIIILYTVILVYSCDYYYYYYYYCHYYHSKLVLS